MTISKKDQVENFISSFIALAYLALAAYCAAILFLRIQRRRRVAKQQLADAATAAARSRISSGFPLVASPSSQSEVTVNLVLTGYGATDTSIASFSSLQSAAPTPVVWDVGSRFYIVTIIEASIRALFFLASTSNKSSLANNSDAMFQTFGLADALFPFIMFLLLYLWFSTLWQSIVAATNLESQSWDPRNVPRLVTATGVVVAGAIAQDVTIAIVAGIVKIPDVIKVINEVYTLFTYLTLAGMFIVVGSQIHRSVVFIPVSDDRLTTQAALVYRVSHIAASGLFVRSCMIGVQFVSQLDDIFSQPWFVQGFYFFFDYCMVLLVVSSMHKRTRH